MHERKPKPPLITPEVREILATLRFNSGPRPHRMAVMGHLAYLKARITKEQEGKWARQGANGYEDQAAQREKLRTSLLSALPDVSLAGQDDLLALASGVCMNPEEVSLYLRDRMSLARGLIRSGLASGRRFTP